MTSSEVPGTMNGAEAGETLDHYRLDALVAETSMAQTFRATDLRDGHRVAIKIPDASLEADPVALARLRREEEIGATLNHPHVMRIVRESHRTGFYLVMEWCEGQPLSAVLRNAGRLPPERAIRITAGILQALEYMHQHGIIHRDLNPDHIMVDEQDGIKLIDFGMALQQGARRITFAGYSPALGTPDYISPEQVKGKRGDARADLYAVGILLWQMLSGRPPFKGSSPMAVMNARLTKNPPPLQLAGFEHAAQLQEVICRATERDPAHRYASAHEFARDLEHLEQVGVVDRPELSERGSGGTRVSSRALVYALLLLLPVLLVGLMLMLSRRH